MLETPVLIAVASGVIGLTSSLLTLRYITRSFVKLGISGIDYHKPGKPRIPEMGGLAFIIGVTAASIPVVLLNLYVSEMLGIVLTVLATGIIGIVDDLRKLGAVEKPLLTAAAGLPLILLHPYSGSLVLPFGIVFRIPLIYMVIIPGLLAVVSNSVNMFDTMNGTATGSSLMVLITLFLVAALKHFIGRGFDILLTGLMFSIILPPLLALFAYNKYPAKVFVGDTGTLSIGGALLAFSVIQSCEIPLIISLLPHLTNGFFNLSSVGRLFERSELKERPIVVSENGVIDANRDLKAPITLTRFVAALGFRSEKEIIRAIMTLCALSDGLAILTVALGLW
jgi:UDP-N-acetylglucosamine--dolichyl-phosphate N-acetylglucosaminephosphotransferase